MATEIIKTGQTELAIHLADRASQQTYQTLITLDPDAAEMFRRANDAQPLAKLNDHEKRIFKPGAAPETELRHSIKYILKNISLFSGLRIEQSEASGIIDLLKRLIPAHYPKMTADEIVHAFELNSMGKLNGGEVIKHFQTFSIDYFGQVMSAYMQHRRKLAPMIQQAFDKSRAALAQPEQRALPSPEDRRRENESFIVSQRAMFEEMGTVFLADTTITALVELGHLPDADGWQSYRDRARQKLIGEKAAEMMTRKDIQIALESSIRNLKAGGHDDAIDGTAKTMFVCDYFRNLSHG